jgi:hypothetical protein
MNTYLDDRLGCPLSLNKSYVNPVATTAEAFDFWHRHPKPNASSAKLAPLRRHGIEFM